MLTAESKVARTEVADPPNADLNCSWKQIVEPVEPFLQTVSQRLIQQVHEFDPQIIPYAKYVLNGSGKHLRPTLVALASRVCGAGQNHRRARDGGGHHRDGASGHAGA